MKSLQFSVPVAENHSIEIQEDVMDSFYPYFHRHNETQIMCIVKGKGTLVIEENLFNFNDGDIFYLGANQSHVFKSDMGAIPNNVHTISIFFDPEQKLHTLFQLPEFATLREFLTVFSVGFKVCPTLVEQVGKYILHLKNTSGIDQIFLFSKLLELLMLHSAKHLPLTKSGTVSKEISEHDKRIIKAKDYIGKHFASTKLTLNEVAQQASLTPQAFCRSFKKHTGLTYVAYLNELKVHKACKLLTTNRTGSISEIAFKSGFTSLTNFNRVFNSVIGCSPKNYLKKYRSIIIAD